MRRLVTDDQKSAALSGCNTGRLKVTKCECAEVSADCSIALLRSSGRGQARISLSSVTAQEATMTGKVSQSVVSDHSMKSSCRSVRSNPGACGAVAGAGMLTLGLVAAPPPISHGRAEVR